ncbi:iron-containing alcohol dehydrogenase family protein [Halorubrum gandharaense]
MTSYDPADSPIGGAVGADPLTFAAVRTRFGDGVADELAAELDRFGVERPLVVTDEGVADAGVLDRVVGGLNRPATRHFATTEPSTADVDDLPLGDADGVVAVGGGSVIDTAKLGSAVAAHGGSAGDYIGVDTLPGPTLPLVAVPTTSGTGSQATQTAVVSHDGVKRGVSDERLRPDCALVDPTLTFGLPASVTRHSGFDAFVHALESLTARDYRWVDERPITYQGANPVSRALSARALRLVHGSLERAVVNGDDREARRRLSLGSHLAGAAFSLSGLGAVHALASSVGGMVDRPHGACLAVSLEPGLRYNLPARGEEYAAVARWLGISTAEHDAAAAADLIDECVRLRDSVGLPASMEAFGLGPDDIDALVENTLVQERRLVTNPRDVRADLREVLAEPLGDE